MEKTSQISNQKQLLFNSIPKALRNSNKNRHKLSNCHISRKDKNLSHNPLKTHQSRLHISITTHLPEKITASVTHPTRKQKKRRFQSKSVVCLTNIESSQNLDDFNTSQILFQATMYLFLFCGAFCWFWGREKYRNRTHLQNHDVICTDICGEGDWRILKLINQVLVSN